MENKNDSSKALITGLIIGGIVGAGALYCIQASRNRQTPVMKKIGKTLSDVGEMLGNCDLDHAKDALHPVEDKMASGADIVSNMTDWISTGMKLWNKFKKG
jgi:gas vesicle protein